MKSTRTLLLVFLLIALLAACSQTQEAGGGELTVLAGSELKDLEPFIPEIQRATGLKLNFNYTGTLDGVESLLAGKKVDLAWFSHGKYLTLLQNPDSAVIAQERMMLSPVVLGVKQSIAQQWGWINNAQLTWKDILTKVESGELHYAMANPVSSNSGVTALVGVASALSGKGDALTVQDINNEALSRFFKGQALTAGSSGWLADSYIREQDRLNGMINYESVLLSLNKNGQLREPLTLIYPSEGIITADYPLMLINAEKRDQYTKLVAFLRTPDMQRKLMEQTLRRPVVPEVALNNQFSSQILVELPFPNSRDVIDTLLFAYLDKQRVPAHAYVVLDISGSMAGKRLEQLKIALQGLTGSDQSLTGQFSRFRQREQITFITFSDTVDDIKDFTINDISPQSRDMEQIRQYAANLSTKGGTAIYSALQEAYKRASAAREAEPNRYYSIVLMSDGENNRGIKKASFEQFYQQLAESDRHIPTFTVLFGDASMDEMQGVANLTGGRVFDAQTTPLNVIFKEIRGYQ